MSKVEYLPLKSDGQVLVVVCPPSERAGSAEDRWRDVACAIAPDTASILRDVARDLLANPQVRAIVFDGPCCGRDAYASLWSGTTPPDFRIDEEHVRLLTSSVDLYDDQFSHKRPMAPYWSTRILYLE